MKYLIDTCVISELASKAPNLGVIAWIDSQEVKDLYICCITIGEIRRGIEKLAESNRREKLLGWLEIELLKNFEKQLISLDTKTMMTWGKLTGKLDKLGKPMPAIDSLIAACALEYNCVLVTRNVNDFKNADLQMLNPWDTY